MSGRATLTMNRSRLASTMPAHTMARTWLGRVLRERCARSPPGPLTALVVTVALSLRTLENGLDDPGPSFAQVAAEIGGHRRKVGAHGDVETERRRRGSRLSRARLLLLGEPGDAGFGAIGPDRDPEA